MMTSDSDNTKENIERGRQRIGEYDISPADIFGFIKVSFPIVFKSTALLFVLGIMYIFVATPKYTATAQLLIENQSQENLFSNEYRRGGVDAERIESQIMLMKSQRVFKLVLKEIGIKRLSQELADDQSMSDEEKFSWAALLLGRNMSVERLSISQIINISFKWKDRQTARDVANAFAKAVITEEFEARVETVKKGREWLETKIEELRMKLNQAAVNIQKFKAKRDYRILSDAPAKTSGKSVSRKNKVKNRRMTFMELETRATSFQKTYEIYLQAYADLIQRQLYPATNTRIISNAVKPLKKSSPKTILILLGSIILGGMIGLGIALVRHSLELYDIKAFPAK